MSKRISAIESNPKPGSLIDLTGRIFGRLYVEHRRGKDNKGEATWLCLCDCGNRKVVRGHCLRAHETSSCGCLQKELIGNRARKHGLSKNTRYKLWTSARLRASKSKLPFDLSWEDIPEIPKTCPVLNIELKYGTRGCCSNSPSLDKIIPERGYVKGNIRVINHRANQLKSDGTPEELMLVAQDAIKLKEENQ